MRHHDLLYGEWEFPPIVAELFRTKELARLRDISQTTIPNLFLPRGFVSSRAHHGLGVARLAEIVLRENPSLAPYRETLYAASLLHDAGNPPFCHLTEPFLRAAHDGKDGESFLEEVLAGSEAERVLLRRGVLPRDVLGFVTGSLSPLSDILNGSLDIDNLDNVGRYAACTALPTEAYDARGIAASFRFDGSRWTLSAEVLPEVRRWQSARQAVYDLVYNTDHIIVQAMLSRAIGLAFRAGEIRREFFLMSNAPAVEYLAESPVQGTRILMDRLARFSWYEEVFRIEELNPAPALCELAESWEGAMRLADAVAERLGVPPYEVSVFVEFGKHKRRIRLPFVHEDGSEFFDESSEEAPLHLGIFVSPELRAERSVVEGVVMGV